MVDHAIPGDLWQDSATVPAARKDEAYSLTTLTSQQRTLAEPNGLLSFNPQIRYTDMIEWSGSFTAIQYEVGLG